MRSCKEWLFVKGSMLISFSVLENIVSQIRHKKGLREPSVNASVSAANVDLVTRFSLVELYAIAGSCGICYLVTPYSLLGFRRWSCCRSWHLTKDGRSKI